jgi:hypothetical protein
LDVHAVLADLGEAAALADQEAVAVVVLVRIEALAGDQPGIGAQVRHGQAGVRLRVDLADEQRTTEGQLRLELTADGAQRRAPAFQPDLGGMMGLHTHLRGVALLLSRNS